MRYRVIALAIFLVTNVIIWYALAREENEVLTVVFLDVGQGDAIFIESPAGNQVLIDGGGGRAVLRELGGVMPFYDRSIDVLIATHPDQDHIGGLPDVLERYDVSFVIESGATNDTGAFDALERFINNEGAEHVRAQRGQIVNLGGGAYLEILFPDRDVSRVGGDTNSASIIAELVYGETEVLLTGDAPDAVENYLALLDSGGLQSDILKVGHHGSRTSTTDLFLSAVRPKYAVISAGEDNRYGHPHKEVLNQLAVAGVAVFGTYESGTIVFKSDGKTLELISQ